MTQPQEFKKGRQSGTRSARRNCGYTLMEIIMVMAIGSILTAAAVPSFRTVINNYRLNSAVAMAKWAIQSTRFQALSKGYNYQVVFDGTNINYQIQDLPSGSTYVNVGSVVPLAAWPMTMNHGSTITFQPNGFVTATNSSFTITYSGVTATLTVSNYGNVTVSCSNGTTTC